MTSFDQHLLDIIQDGFPIAERPYAEIADLLNQTANGHPEDTQDQLSEQSVFEAVERLRDGGVIRRIGGVYDSRKLGFVSRLCAGVVPAISNGAKDDSALEKFAAAVNEVPAITHNYVRSYHYNVWFTVIAESESAVQAIVASLEKTTDLRDVHCLSAKRMFKINTVMGNRDERRKTRDEKAVAAGALTESDKLRVRLLSGDLPHSLTPFADLCGKSGHELLEFLDGARSDLATRRMRRFGAILRHQAAGFAHNAMVCFAIAESREPKAESDACELAGLALASNPHVSHCYERSPFDGFPYNVYAMFHASSAEELDCFIADAAQSVGCTAADYAVLHSVRELKKTSFTFFAD